jgi:hypothetical protein
MSDKPKNFLPGLTGERNKIFWSSFTRQEFHELCQTSTLSQKHKELLCRLSDIQDVPEGDVEVAINHAELERFLWEEWKRHPEIFKKKPPKPKRR